MVSLYNVLAVSPHVDDVELGVGGLLYRLSKSGFQITLALMSASDYTDTRGSLIKWTTRLVEQDRAASILGVQDCQFLDVAKENQFPQGDRGAMVHALDALIEKVRPAMLFIPAGVGNQDHVVTHKACLAALRFPNRHKVGEVHVYEVADTPRPCNSAQVYWRLDSSSIDAKKRALAEFSSQKGAARGLIDACGPLASWRGTQCGGDFAEMTYMLDAVR